MLNENIREKMIIAYESGRFEEALKLSREFDKEILKYYKKLIVLKYGDEALLKKHKT